MTPRDPTRQTGVGTSPNDVADPHPSNEEHPYRAPHPGGTRPPKGTTQRVNDATHDGTPQRRPDNAETDTGSGTS